MPSYSRCTSCGCWWTPDPEDCGPDGWFSECPDCRDGADDPMDDRPDFPNEPDTLEEWHERTGQP